MVLAKPQYKICKRLGNGIYEKCQTQKFALSEARAKKTFKRRRTLSDFGRQLLEKQKVRYAYGITERQLRRYADAALKTKEPAAALFAGLETRLDNAIYRLGLAPTRRAARQMVNHGHITVNGKKMTIPSHRVLVKDTLAVRDASKERAVFTNRTDEIASHTAPAWLKLDPKKLTATVAALPEFTPSDHMFDFPAVFEFYSR